MIKVSKLKRFGDWNRVLNNARFTVGKSDIDKEPSDKFKRRMLLAEHSPIRGLEYEVTWSDIKMWVTVHLVRHSIGCTPYVNTQRIDRNNLLYDGKQIKSRDELGQGEPNNMRWSGNAQSIINVSRKRLCSKASAETRHAWKLFLSELKTIDPILVEKCVAECYYRGFCPEDKCCGIVNKPDFADKLAEYRKV